MTKEIRSPNFEGRSGVQWLIRPADFGIPSDFVIRHSGLRMAVPGEPPTAFPACGSSREDSPFQPGVQGVETVVLPNHRPVLRQFVLQIIGGSAFLGDV